MNSVRKSRSSAPQALAIGGGSVYLAFTNSTLVAGMLINTQISRMARRRNARFGSRSGGICAVILAVLSSIFFGLATPTEAAGVGAAGALLLALVKKQLSRPVMGEVLQETTRTTAFIFAVLLGATAFALVLRGLGGDGLIHRALLGLPFGPDGVIICILIATFLLGFFLDWIEITLIILPLVAPVVIGLNFDPVWFTILFAVCLQTSFLTPPVGVAIFYLKGVAPPDIKVTTVYRGVIPFIILQLVGLVIIYKWQSLVTWLPAQAYSQ